VGARLVRIRICGDYGIFRILTARVFDLKALIRIRLGGIFGYAKRASWANRNPGNPAKPDSDKDAGAANDLAARNQSPSATGESPLSFPRKRESTSGRTT